MSSTTQEKIVPASLQSVLLAKDSPARQALYIMNNSTAVLYIRFGEPATAATPTIRIPAEFLYEAPLNRGGQPYTGSVYGVWAAINGQAVVTEIP